jgi:hypothetical protein
MKSCKQLVVVAIFAALAVAGLNAQVVDMRASIPFDFHAGNTFMPAGEYRIHGQDSVVFVRGADTGTPVSILMTNSVAGRGPAHDARLEFTRYGNEYFLTTVWNSVTQDGRQTLPTARERELAKQGVVPAKAVVTLASSK